MVRRSRRRRIPTPVLGRIEIPLRGRRSSARDTVVAGLGTQLRRDLVEADAAFDRVYEDVLRPGRPPVLEVIVAFVDRASRRRWRTHPSVRRQLADLRPHMAGPPRMHALANPCEDDHLCTCPFGRSPLFLEGSFVSLGAYLCGACDGIIPPRKIPQEISAANWLHDVRLIDFLWLWTGPYEPWAARQLNDPRSAHNRGARDLARRATAVLGTPVYARQSTHGARRDARCPSCRRASERSPCPRTDFACRRCHIAWAVDG